MSDEFESPFDDDLDSGESESGDETSKDTDKADGDQKESSEASAESKRIRDLQSKADKAEAERNKLKKQLDEMVAAAKEKDEDEVPPQVREWLLAAKKRTSGTLYESDSRFKEYGLDPAFISGSTPAEMQERAEALSKLVTQIEGEARNKVLTEHGFSPEPATSERSEPKNYRTMSSEEFNKEVEKALGSGTLRRS
jgi:seryl-tRNA synthetase